MKYMIALLFRAYKFLSFSFLFIASLPLEEMHQLRDTNAILVHCMHAIW